MSALEKFGILVILVLVVIIGMVAVWGVGTPAGETPFGGGEDVAAVPDPAAAGDRLPEWPAPPVDVPPAPGPGVAAAPPAIGAAPLPPAGSPPSVTVAPPAVPAPPATARTRTIRSGDTLAKIAKEEFGDSSMWKRIVDANPGLDPRRLKVNSTIVIPDVPSRAGDRGRTAEAPVSPWPANALLNPADGPTAPPSTSTPPAPASTARTEEYEIRSGDTLSSIAASRMGNSAEWYRILEANPGLDVKRLPVGRRIQVPVGR